MSRNDPILAPPEEQPLGADTVLDLVNEANGTEYVLDDILFGTPKPMPQWSIKNTVIELNPTTTGAFRRSALVYYDRLDLNVLLTPFAITVEESGVMTFANSEDILQALEDQTQIVFSAAEFEALPVEGVTFPKKVTLRAVADSLKYCGEFIFFLTEAEEMPP